MEVDLTSLFPVSTSPDEAAAEASASVSIQSASSSSSSSPSASLLAILAKGRVGENAVGDEERFLFMAEDVAADGDAEAVVAGSTVNPGFMTPWDFRK